MRKRKKDTNLMNKELPYDRNKESRDGKNRVYREERIQKNRIQNRYSIHSRLKTGSNPRKEVFSVELMKKGMLF
jgi:hypothetical protein